MILTVIGSLFAVLAVLIVRRRIRYPNHSWLLCVLNVTLWPYRWLFLKTEPISKSIDKVMAATKASDFGDNESTFRYMYEWVQSTATFKSLVYSNIGKIMSNMEMSLTMARRIKFTQYLKRNPEILDIPVTSPVFVCGLGRSGTTFLHRLLSLDPAVRSPYLWECLNGVPTKAELTMRDPEAMAKDRQKRKTLMKKNLETRDWMGDSSMEHIHEVGYDLPEECLFFLSNDLPFTFNYLYSVFLEAASFFYAPKHADHLIASFETHKKYIQMLAYQGEDVGTANLKATFKKEKRWVLKCPLHLMMVKPLAHVYPDAKFIWAHRHPVKNFSSICGLIKAMFNMYFEKECADDKKIGRNIFNFVSEVLKKAPLDMKEAGVPCANVIFDDLIADPISVIESIYKQYNWDMSEEYRVILEKYIAENAQKREKTGAGSKALGAWHSLEGFGITKEELLQGNYANYIKEFNLPLKGK
jgi:hypothetical protein